MDGFKDLIEFVIIANSPFALFISIGMFCEHIIIWGIAFLFLALLGVGIIIYEAVKEKK